MQGALGLALNSALGLIGLIEQGFSFRVSRALMTGSIRREVTLESLLGGLGELATSYYRLVSTITPIGSPFRVLITLLHVYLLSPPTLQVNP